MADWKQQLKNIQQLRLQQREADEILFTSQTKFVKAAINLNRAKRQETSAAPDTRAIEMIRRKIAQLESTLVKYNAEISEIDKVSTRLNESSQLVVFLEKRIEVLSSPVADLKRQLRAEQGIRGDRFKALALQRQLDAIDKQVDELKTNQAAAASDQKRLVAQQRTAQARKKELEKLRSTASTQINRYQLDFNNELSGTRLSINDAEKAKNEWQEKRVKSKAGINAAVRDLQTAIAGIYVEDPHPRAVIRNLNDNIPFLLLPVRIETKFMTVASKTELWLRVYPDDIAIHTHEKVLTDDEVKVGTAYWSNLFDAEKSDAAEKENRKKAAWNQITDKFGGNRSAWIARMTRPDNWTSDLAGIDSVDDLLFPAHDLTLTNAWSRAPRTTILPDKFVVMLYQGNSIAKEIVGPLIPDQLFVGPDPMESEDAFIKTNEGLLAFGEAYNWTSDFEKAVQYGMGFKIPLNTDEASKGFDKILVMGAFLSADETETKNAIEALIDNHHYSPDGFSIVRQGTPTNNTEQDGSGFSASDPMNSTSYYVETGQPLFSEDESCDGKNLADALGISYLPLQFIQNSNAKDLDEAVAMNKALYPSTLGYYFSTMMKPVLDEADQNKLRRFFLRHVTGRGPLPAIRVGNQPYGVMVTSDFNKWKWLQNETWGNKFLDTFYQVLSHFHSMWMGLSSQLSYAGKPGADPNDVLMDILGLQAGSVSFYQRVAFSAENLVQNGEFFQDSAYLADLQENFINKRVIQNLLTTFGYQPGPDGNLVTPQLLKLVLHHRHTQLDASNVVDAVPLSESESLKPYHESVDKNYIDWLIDNGSIASLEKQDFGPGKIPTSLLYMQLRRSLLLELSKATVDWFRNNNILVEQVMAPANFHNLGTNGDVTKWEVMKAKVSNVLPRHPQREMSVADYLLTTGKNDTAGSLLVDLKEGLKTIANLPTARMERCFTEHLDTCSFRLDAWQTALFHQRLQKQRGIESSGSAVNKGTYVGAYGCVFDVRPAEKRKVVTERLPSNLQPPDSKPLYEYADNGGFVHAPSINQATAAAVLRSGYLNHASAAHPETMAVNLSSDRVRRAMMILDGIRNGQSLEVLLGYQFERGLHDRGSVDDSLKKLNEFIYDFRDKYQIETNLVQQQGAQNENPKTIKTNSVVNGLVLAENSGAFPYGVSLKMDGLTTVQKAGLHQAIVEEKDKLDDTLDAVKDLLLSESVYQMVQGNFDRAAAITNALRDSNIPPEIEIVNTPQSSHLTFTNRVTVQFEQISATDIGANPWTPVPMTPRAIAEPGLNKWLGRILGNPSRLSCKVSFSSSDEPKGMRDVTIDKLNIQPIDLIYIAGNELNTGEENRSASSELESRISSWYRKENGLDDEIPVAIRFLESVDPGKTTLGSILPMIRMLRAVITDSRPLHADDFTPASKRFVTDKANPKGYVTTQLSARIQHALVDFKSCFAAIVELTLVEADSSAIVGLGDLFALMDVSGQGFEELEFEFQASDAQLLQGILTRVSGYGLSDTFPIAVNAIEHKNKIRLLQQARDAVRRMNVIILKVEKLVTEIAALGDSEKERQVMKLIEAGKALFGESFNLIPQFTYNTPEDIRLSHESDSLLKYAREELQMKFVADEWLQQISHVRPRLAKWDYIRTLYELSNNDTLTIDPVQLPYRSGDSWIATEFPATHEDGTPFSITDDTLSIVVHGDAAFLSTNTQGGLLLDDWTEMIPNKEEVTGLTFNYNQPNAMAPQALLLAVTPEEKGNWDWDTLVGIVNDTFTRARLRAIEPKLLDTLSQPEASVLLPALLSNFSKHDLDFSLDYARNVGFMNENIPTSTITTNP